MTPRQRFAKTMRYLQPDRVPYFEEGLRDNVPQLWQEQGLPADADLATMFDFDHRERVPVDLGPRPELEEWPTSRRGLADLRRRLDPDDPQRLPEDWPGRVEAWRGRDAILELPIHHGFFLSMGVGEWLRLEQLLCQLADQPGLVAEMMAIHGRFAARMAERVLAEVEVDFASFSEPIAGSNGPLISPQTYKEVVLEAYRPILDVLRSHGVEIICFLTYANARDLLPAVVDAGFNCLWACEAGTEAMDYRDLRRQFGRHLRLIGGIDLDALLLDKAAIRREIEAKVPPLLADGGYVPLADGRIRVNVPFENYLYYRRQLERVTQP